MLYDSKMMKSFPQSFAYSSAPSLQAAPDAPGPALRRLAFGAAALYRYFCFADPADARLSELLSEPRHAPPAGRLGAAVRGRLCGEAGLVPPARAENAATSPALERRVKAAFLYKFLGYAEFPTGAFADAASPVVIGVAGADDLAAELARIVSGRTVNNRTIVVRVLREPSSASRCTCCSSAASTPAGWGAWCARPAMRCWS
jgi:hypothetical protein